ncbi:hypothetical protein JTY60_01565 [symbiont of Argiope bruennichi]|uniref:hypothetical protein n=1 Tax=symbiont of Argiope bruennichi TaxID=2810479 RepID=UPI003DA6CAC2
MKRKKLLTKILGLISCFSALAIVGCKKDDDSDPLSYLQNCIDKNFNGKSNTSNKIANIVAKNFDQSKDETVIYSDSNTEVHQDKFRSDNISGLYYDKNDPANLLFENNYISKDHTVYYFLVKFKLNDLNTTFYFPLAIVLNSSSIDLSDDNSYKVATKKVGNTDNPLITTKFPFAVGKCLPDGWFSLLSGSN